MFRVTEVLRKRSSLNCFYGRIHLFNFEYRFYKDKSQLIFFFFEFVFRIALFGWWEFGLYGRRMGALLRQVPCFPLNLLTRQNGLNSTLFDILFLKNLSSPIELEISNMEISSNGISYKKLEADSLCMDFLDMFAIL